MDDYLNWMITLLDFDFDNYNLLKLSMIKNIIWVFIYIELIRSFN